LAHYDEFKGNNNPNLQLRVASPSRILMRANFTSASAPPARSAVAFETTGKNGSIGFSATGRGQASVVFGASFIPLEIFTEPINRGIQVKKIIQRLNLTSNLPSGPAINSAALGEKVVVTIEFTIADAASTIVISDPFPGALEPQDDLIYSGQTTSRSNPSSRYDFWGWYLQSAFSMKEFRKDKVVFYGQRLFAGTHTVTYTALVSTLGQFVLPPTLVSDALQPEVMGLSAGGVFITKTMPSNVILPPAKCLPFKAVGTPPTAEDIARATSPEETTAPTSHETSLPSTHGAPLPSSHETPLPSSLIALAVLGVLFTIIGVIILAFIIRRNSSKTVETV